MTFTDHERADLDSQHLGRIATASRSGEPDIAPVGFGVARRVATRARSLSPGPLCA